MRLNLQTEVIHYFYSVYSCRYATTARWADIQGPFLGNDSVNTFHSNRHEYEELHFLCGPLQDVTGKRQNYNLVSSVKKFVKIGVEPKAEE
jgi:hypothetical protein